MLQTTALYLAAAILVLGALLAVPWRALFRTWAGARPDDERREAPPRLAGHHARTWHAKPAPPSLAKASHPTMPHHARSVHERTRHHSRRTLHHL